VPSTLVSVSFGGGIESRCFYSQRQLADNGNKAGTFGAVKIQKSTRTGTKYSFPNRRACCCVQ